MRVPQQNFQFCGPTYSAVSPVIDAERSVNLYPESALASSKTHMALVGRPGLSGWTTLPNSPARALWAGNGRLFAVGGSHLYELSALGAVITDYGAGLTGTGNAPCAIIANGIQLLVHDSGAAKVFFANTVGPVLTQVFAATALEYLDGFYVAIATGASLAGSNPNQINVSASLDGTTWPALNYVIRTGAADLTNQLATLNGLLWIFGQKSIEVWYNAGNALFPFARVNGGTINLGLLAPQSVVKFYDSILWLGADDRGYAQVYQAQGMSPKRVSNAAIESLLKVYQVAYGYSLKAATAYGYQEGGHTFYCLNLNNPSSPVATIVYDLTTGMWHERTYGVAGPWPTAFASVPSFGNLTNFVGDGYSGNIMQQDIALPNDGDPITNKITYVRQAPHVSDNNLRSFYNRFELSGEFGTATPTLDWADGGMSWIPNSFYPGSLIFGGRTRALQQAAPPSGAPPAGDLSPTFRRFYATQLGQSRDRVFQVTITDGTNLIRIANAFLDADDGTA